jgi:hypothetical protein
MRVYRIMIRCPATGKIADTGLETTSQQEFAAGAFIGQRLTCPHCGQVHRWQKEEAFLQVDDTPSTGRLWRPNR